MKGFLKKEKVCEGNRMFCDRCNEKQDAEFVSDKLDLLNSSVRWLTLRLPLVHAVFSLCGAGM